LSRISAAMVVVALLSTAILAVRSAMRDRREHAEQAWRDARKCALSYAQARTATNPNDLQACTGAARNAAALTLEMPEHDGQQLELQAALDELVSALDSGDQHRLSSAIERSSRAGSALGWQTVRSHLR